MSELKGKELAIAVAEKLGDKCNLVFLKRDDAVDTKNFNIYVSAYLRNKFTDVILSDGMAGEIKDFLYAGYHVGHNDDQFATSLVLDDLCGSDNNGTLTPEKILNIWLELKE